MNNIPNTKISNDELLELLTLTIDISRNGDTRYFNSAGQLHRIHGPAVIYRNGEKQWWKNGNLHRDGDLPAYITPDGTQYWYNHGKLHRINEPAVIFPGERLEWWENGEFKREEWIDGR